MPVVRYLEWFDTVTEKFVGRVELLQTLEELQELFGVQGENSMFDCWEVKPAHVEYLQVCTGERIGLNRYAYFICAEVA